MVHLTSGVSLMIDKEELLRLVDHPVVVRWIDSRSYDGWHDKELEVKSLMCSSIGWLHKVADDHIEVISGMADPGDLVLNRMAIPLVSVKVVTLLEKNLKSG